MRRQYWALGLKVTIEGGDVLVQHLRRVTGFLDSIELERVACPRALALADELLPALHAIAANLKPSNHDMEVAVPFHLPLYPVE